MRNGIQLIILLIVFVSGLTTVGAEENLVSQVMQILKETPLIDGHNDLAWVVRDKFDGQLAKLDLRSDTSSLGDVKMHTDIPRLRKGGVGAQFWSAYIPVKVTGTEATETVLEQIDIIHRVTAAYPDVFESANTAGDIERIHRSGKIASLIGVEGGHCINSSLPVLRQLYQNGVRYMTLTHWKNTPWADAATAPPQHEGLTPFGEQVVMEMNRLGMLVDLSHVSPDTMKDVLRITKAPVIFSHSSVCSISHHPRNVPDEILTLLPPNGGVVMVNFAPSFLSEEARQYSAVKSGEKKRLKQLYPADPERVKKELETWEKKHPNPGATLQIVADHIDFIRKIAGIDHVGIGSDFDGIDDVPAGLEDVATFPALFVELLKRGYTADEVRKVAGLNLLRVMRQCEQVAQTLKAETRPIELPLGKLPTDDD